MKLQKTIKSEGRLVGRGMFAGKEAKVVFRPAPTNSGLTFVRTDVAEPVRMEKGNWEVCKMRGEGLWDLWRIPASG